MKSFVEESNCRVRNSSSRLPPSPSVNRRASADTHLSIGCYSPTWPIGASPNGVLNYVGFLSEQLEAIGHHTTILADAVAEGDHAPGVYNLQEIRTSIARNPVNRIMYGLWRRLAAHPANSHLYRRALVTTFHRAIAVHGLDILEMEETYGWRGAQGRLDRVGRRRCATQGCRHAQPYHCQRLLLALTQARRRVRVDPVRPFGWPSPPETSWQPRSRFPDRPHRAVG